MAETELKGLALAEKYYSQYGARARELKGSGRRIIGYLSALTPLKSSRRPAWCPLRLKGNVSEAITKADAHMETIVCPFVRNVFDAALKGRFLFSTVWCCPTSVTAWRGRPTSGTITSTCLIGTFSTCPTSSDAPSMEFTREILRIFVATLERLTGAKITDDDLHSRRSWRTTRTGGP